MGTRIEMVKRWVVLGVVAGAAAVGVAGGGGQVHGAESIRLGKLRPTDQFSDASAVSADGLTVVGESYSATGPEAFRWTISGGMQSLGLGVDSYAGGVSADGSVIAASRTTGVQMGEPVRWTTAVALGLGSIAGGKMFGGGNDISADGSVIVGGGTSPVGVEAYRWTAATGMVGLGQVPGGDFGSFARAVSADGNVIVGNVRRERFALLSREAYRWTAETGYVPLGDLPGGQFYSEAFDVSADGSVVVGTSTINAPTYRAFRWTEETGMEALPPILGIGFAEAAYGISGDGKVIVGVGSGGAFVWDAFHGSRNLRALLTEQGVDLGAFQLVAARSASWDGQTIVGLGRHTDLGDEAFLVRLDPGTFVPEPGTIVLGLLFVVGLVGFLVFARRRGGGGSPLRGWDF